MMIQNFRRYIPMSKYRAPFYLPGGHFQTLAGALAPSPALRYLPDRWDIEQPKDFIDVDWVGARGSQPLLVLFHGLEGHSRTAYARKLGAHVTAHGWRFAVPHFRGCSREANLQLRSYHAGSSDEIDLMLRTFAEKHDGPVFAVGVSLGANALLKWLGERGDEASRLVRRAVAISAPVNLEATGAVLARGFGLLYAWTFLARYLRKRALEKLRRFPGAFDERRVRAAWTLREFEDAVTAPVHDFRDAHDYWARSSALQFLEGIRVPTLLLSARNDPFTPDHVLRGVQRLQDHGKLPAELTLDFQDEGGHAGFVGHDAWLRKRVYAFLSAA